jgi:Ca2+-dependent lipid-binding protein
MKKLFEKFWLKLGILLGVAILDLIFITQFDFSILFVFAFFYFLVGGFIYMKELKDKNS